MLFRYWVYVYCIVLYQAVEKSFQSLPIRLPFSLFPSFSFSFLSLPFSISLSISYLSIYSLFLTYLLSNYFIFFLFLSCSLSPSLLSSLFHSFYFFLSLEFIYISFTIFLIIHLPFSLSLFLFLSFSLSLFLSLSFYLTFYTSLSLSLSEALYHSPSFPLFISLSLYIFLSFRRLPTQGNKSKLFSSKISASFLRWNFKDKQP